MASSAPAAVHAFEPFVVEDIRVEGLQRIAAGTVFNYLPVQRGDRIDETMSSEAIRALFKTGFFRDVVLERDGNELVVFVAERPAIASIDIEGNVDLKAEDLLTGLEGIGFAEGRVFNRSMLDRVEQELKRQYLSLGKYGVRIKSQVEPLERNRVAVTIKIAEGSVATIRHINIVGNQAFGEEELLDEFELGPQPWYLFLSDRDQYSKQRLSADIETLRSFYYDRGYLNFAIDSTQVSITPDLRDVYVTINVREGARYKVKAIKVAGDTKLPEKELRELISVNPGDVFSRREVTDSADRISERLGAAGYAFANINPIPEVDEENQEVTLTFFVDPAKRVYVRRVNVSGNSKTQDEVIRREIRQMESGWMSTEQVQHSKRRLDRLGFFNKVNVETPAVPGVPDQVDVNYDVEERDAFGSLNFGIGYGEAQGLLVNASVSQDNFLGTGKRFSVAVDNSDVNTIYSFSFSDPYYTLDGISRSFNTFYRETDAGEANVADYTTDAYGAGMNFGIPLSEYDRATFGGAYEHTSLNTTPDTTQEILDFVDDNGSEFNAYKLTASWSHDTRNKAIFPDSGNFQSLNTEVALPGGDLNFYKLYYRYKQYIPVADWITFMGQAQLGHGEAFGDTTELPPFERYYAGGTRSVRGYKANSLGPEDEYGDPLGGSTKVVGNLELIFPSPFTDNKDSIRVSTFLDAGQVYQGTDDIDMGEIRYSAGVSMVWLTPIGALSFSVAEPLNDEPGDNTENFQFTLGSLY